MVLGKVEGRKVKSYGVSGRSKSPSPNMLTLGEAKTRTDPAKGATVLTADFSLAWSHLQSDLYVSNSLTSLRGSQEPQT